VPAAVSLFSEPSIEAHRLFMSKILGLQSATRVEQLKSKNGVHGEALA
jgi:hypothetical protein